MKFKRVIELSNDPGDFSVFNAPILIPKTVAEAVTLVKRFHKLAVANGKYALDTETSGVLWTVDELFLVSLYTGGMSLIIPAAWSNPCISVADLPLILGPLVNDASICCILHNAKFDMHFLLNHNVVIKNEVHDTIVAGFVLDVEKPNGLKERAKAELKLEMQEFRKLFPLGGKQKLRLNDYPVGVVSSYAALDTFATYGLSEVFLTSTPQINCKHRLGLNTDDQDLQHIYDRVDAPMVRMFFDMERYGVKVDMAVAEKLRSDYTNKLAHLEKEIFLEAGTAFNMNSWQQVKKVFAGRGIPLKSTDEKHLSRVVRERGDRLAELMLLYRGDFKISSNYINSVFRFKDVDNRVHTSLNLHMAGTGRVSSSNPINL